MSKKMPLPLVRLGKEMLLLLGNAIAEEYGTNTFKLVDSIRKKYRLQEKTGKPSIDKVHAGVYELLKKQSEETRFQISHSFASALEIINSCENAYRSFRLDQTQGEMQGPKLPVKSEQKILFVLTAHPTESRSKATLEISNRLTSALLDYLKGGALHRDKVYASIRMLLKVPIVKSKQPEVIDEAEYIYSSLLKEENLRVAYDRHRSGTPVYFRTWVGGDKDGHPGVNDRVMQRSLSCSRKYCLQLFEQAMSAVIADIAILSAGTSELYEACQQDLSLFLKDLKGFKVILSGDGDRLLKYYKLVRKRLDKVDQEVGFTLDSVDYLRYFMDLFPAMVVSLEFREDSEIVHQAINDDKLAIAKMIHRIKEIAGSMPPSKYVRGLVLSMCESAEDYRAGLKLLEKGLGGLKIPVVPLFETRKALEESSQIVDQIFSDKSLIKKIEKNWDNKFEVMLGYSDSAKENGSLASKLMIYQTLRGLEKKVSDYGMKPIFFHGSGGSVARGGGSLEDQIRWWPGSAIRTYKATIQGEMVHRSFSSPQIFRRQLDKLSEACIKADKRNVKALQASTKKFGKMVAESYYQKISEPDFLRLVEKSSPYEYLDQLKIGSRPSKRKMSLSLSSLRAIPWVLCWTQNRLLFPVWWGLGSSWKKLNSEDRKKLKKSYVDEPVFRAFVHLCSYTMAKTDLSIFKFYLEKADLSEDVKTKYIEEIQSEYELSLKFIRTIMGKKNLLWYRPWLLESISYRNTYIHPLSILEWIALENKEIPLLRESIAGVASGMLTTG